MLIGPKIQQMRESKLVLIEDLCQYLGITVATYNNFENGSGNISCGLLFKITNFLDINPNEVLLTIKEKSEEEYLICKANFILAQSENSFWQKRLAISYIKKKQ